MNLGRKKKLGSKAFMATQSAGRDKGVTHRVEAGDHPPSLPALGAGSDMAYQDRGKSKVGVGQALDADLGS